MSSVEGLWSVTFRYGNLCYDTSYLALWAGCYSPEGLKRQTWILEEVTIKEGIPWVGKIPLEKEMGAHSSILPWRAPRTEERSLAGYGPQDCRELDMTEATPHSTQGRCTRNNASASRDRKRPEQAKL